MVLTISARVLTNFQVASIGPEELSWQNKS